MKEVLTAFKQNVKNLQQEVLNMLNDANKGNYSNYDLGLRIGDILYLKDSLCLELYTVNKQESVNSLDKRFIGNANLRLNEIELAALHISHIYGIPIRYQ